VPCWESHHRCCTPSHRQCHRPRLMRTPSDPFPTPVEPRLIFFLLCLSSLRRARSEGAAIAIMNLTAASVSSSFHHPCQISCIGTGKTGSPAHEPLRDVHSRSLRRILRCQRAAAARWPCRVHTESWPWAPSALGHGQSPLGRDGPRHVLASDAVWAGIWNRLMRPGNLF
jgi:hypothetical protein